MPNPVEQEPVKNVSDVEERAQGITEVAPDIENVAPGVKATPVNPQPVTDDQGNMVATPTDTSTVTIQVPTDDATLTQMSKGDPDNAVVGFARYWLRLIKKALFFGWKIVSGKGDK